MVLYPDFKSKWSEMVEHFKTSTPGLFNKNPSNTRDINSHDNMDGIFAGSYLFATPEYDDIYQWGRTHGFVYNNIDPLMYDLKAQRSPVSIYFYRSMMGELLAPWENLFFTGHCIWSALAKGSSEKLLTFMRLELLNSVDNFMFTNKIFHTIIAKKYKRGIQDVFAEYFKEDHPIVALAEGL